jgi:hypothetical protein
MIDIQSKQMIFLIVRAPAYWRVKSRSLKTCDHTVEGMMKFAHILHASAALGALMLAIPAMAQGAPAHSAAAAASTGDQGIKDIIVTAQRREENLQKPALAVSAVAGEALTKAG